MSATITVTPTAASRLEFATPPSGGTDSQALSASPVVDIQDVGGNVISSNAAVTLSINSAPTGGGSLLCNENPVTAVAGVATFSGCTITGTVGSYTLTASASGLTSVTSSSIMLVPAMANIVAVTSGSGSGGASATASNGPITVTLENMDGNPPTDAADVTIGLSSTSRGAVFSTTANGPSVNTLTIPAGQSSAIFYYGDSVVGTPTISLSAGGFSTITESETIVPAAAASLAITTPPVSAEAGVPFTVGVQLVDAYDNPVAEGGTTVSLRTSPATTLNGSTTIVTGTAGSALATNLVIPTAGSYTVTATSAGLSPSSEDSIAVMISAKSVIVTTPSAPSTPLATVVSQPPGSAALSWSAPSDGGSEITGYAVTPTDETTSTTGTSIIVSDDTTKTVVSGLTPGDVYAFIVVAINAIGTGPASPSSNQVEPVEVAPIVSVSGFSASASGTATASAGNGTAGSITVSASGAGTVTVSHFAEPPVPGAPTNLSFYDVSVSPGSNFTLASKQICSVATGSPIEWQNPMTHVFTVVSDQSISAETACASVTVTPTSIPNTAELYGSIFAVLLATSLPTPEVTGATSFRVSHQGTSEFGAPVRYSARLSVAGKPVTSGAVTFSVGAAVLCSARVTNGQSFLYVTPGATLGRNCHCRSLPLPQ